VNRRRRTRRGLLDKTAKNLGLAFSPQTLSRADEVLK
jgi:hypothetical protein